jgi:diguanylate cyclase (GGDEF)-like protein
MTQPATGRRVTYGDVLANPEFRALYVAQSLSLLGDQLAKIAVALLVFHRSHSALLTALSFAATFLPWAVGGPLLGTLADRLPRQQLMVMCDFVRAGLIVIIAVPGVPLWLAIALVFLVSTLDPPFAAARGALVPDIFRDEDRFTVASALLITTNQLAQVVGFAGGGVLVALSSPRGAIIIDCLTFVVSGFVVRLRVHDRPVSGHAPTNTWSALGQGARFIRRDRRLFDAVLISWTLVAASVAPEAIAVPYASAHGGGPMTAGLLTAALPLGGVAGAILIGRVLRPRQGERLLPTMAVATTVLLAFTGFDPPAAVAGVLWALAGITSACVVVAGRLLVQRTEPHVRGRILGIAGAGLAVAQGGGALLSGLIASHLSPAIAVADVALPALAVLVVLFAGINAVSSSRAAIASPMSEAMNQATGADVRPADRTSVARRIGSVSIGLLCMSGFGLWLMRGDKAIVPIHLSPIWLALLFVTVRSYPLTFEFRRKLLAVNLDSVPLILALFFLDPLSLFCVRVGADIASSIVRRQPPLHALFNAAGSAFYSVTVIAIFHTLAPGHPSVRFATWVAAAVALLCDDLISAIVATSAAFYAGRPVRLAEMGTPLAFSTGVTLVNACLGLVTASAVVYDSTNIWAITIFVVLALVGFRTYHQLADRHALLDKLYAFARDLGPISRDPAEIGPALTQLRILLRASELEFVLRIEGGLPLSVLAAEEDGRDAVRVREVGAEDERARMLASEAPRLGRRSLLGRRRRQASLSAEQMTYPVQSANQIVGVLSAQSMAEDGRRFDRNDLRLLEAIADQIGAALEKGALIENLRSAATRDSLTGLANLDSLREFLVAMLQEGSNGVLLLLDIDRFHDINDTLGHDSGDGVLVEVARRLEDAATQGSLACRVGGDQFALVIPGQSSGELARLAALAVKSRIDGPLRLADVSADIRVTIGMARAPDHGTDATTLLRRAEIAMGSAKGGSSGISEWEASMERDGSRRLYVLAGLRQALADSDLTVEFQPKLQLGTGEVTGFEALVRWRHPDLGPVPPSEFIPLAEATGLVSALTSGVLRMSLEACRRWHDAGKFVSVAVNVSARSLDDPVLVGQVAALLTASGLDSRWLTLEITESSVMENPSRSLEVLRQLRSLGVKLSIDDFGTGYSSLHYLRGLPIHEVKIDKSFVDHVDGNGADRAVVRAVVELCDSLGLTTVAEGVEQASQAYALEALGIKQVQGYFYGRPMPEADATKWLKHRPIATAWTEERQRG